MRAVVQEVGMQGKCTPKSFDVSKIGATPLKIRERTLKIWAKMAVIPKKVFMIFRGRKFVHEVAQKLFGQVWENSSKNHSHYQNVSCSYIHAWRLTWMTPFETKIKKNTAKQIAIPTLHCTSNVREIRFAWIIYFLFTSNFPKEQIKTWESKINTTFPLQKI